MMLLLLLFLISYVLQHERNYKQGNGTFYNSEIKIKKEKKCKSYQTKSSSSKNPTSPCCSIRNFPKIFKLNFKCNIEFCKYDKIEIQERQKSLSSKNPKSPCRQETKQNEKLIKTCIHKILKKNRVTVS